MREEGKEKKGHKSMHSKHVMMGPAWPPGSTVRGTRTVTHEEQ